MLNTVLRLLAIPCILLALFLIGAPNVMPVIVRVVSSSAAFPGTRLAPAGRAATIAPPQAARYDAKRR